MTKLKLEATTSAIDLAVDEAELLIKNYCSINYVPGELMFTWANIALDIIKADDFEDVSLAGEVLTSVSMGDTSYSFASAGKRQFLAALRDNYSGILNKYRRGLFGDE